MEIVSGVPSSRRKAYSTLIYDCCGELSASRFAAGCDGVISEVI